ncbi:MAG: recombinase family protein [Bacillota bacterium]
MTIKRAVGYTRVSTKEQGEFGYSIDAQHQVIENYCRQHGYELVAIYEDKGVSGKSTEGRKALENLMTDARKGNFDLVLVWKTSRLARKQLDLLSIVSELGALNVSFKSCTENFDTDSPSGKLLFQIMGGISEFERNTIVENVRMGMKQRAREGEWNGGIILGYDVVRIQGKNTKDIHSSLVINAQEAMIVQEIFELYASGKGLKAIVGTLNRKGYKTKKGNPFNVNGVRDILHNPTYTGKIRFNVRENWSEKRRKGFNPNPIIVPGKHEGIISEELWNKVRQIYDSKSGRQKKTFHGSFPLTGLLRCPKCNSGMVAHHTTKTRKDGTKYTIRYYHCGSFKNKGSSICRSNGIRADYAEEHVFKRLAEVITNEKVLKDIIDSLNNKKKNELKPLEGELQYIEKQLEELAAKNKKYLKMFEEDLLDSHTIKERLGELQNESKRYKERKEEVLALLSGNDSQEIPYEMVKAVFTDFYNALMDAPDEHKKMLLQLIIKKITISEKREIDSIELFFDENIIKFFIDDEPPSPDGGPFLCQKHKGLQLFVVRFPLYNPKPSINLLQQDDAHQLMGESHR